MRGDTAPLKTSTSEINIKPVLHTERYILPAYAAEASVFCVRTGRNSFQARRRDSHTHRHIAERCSESRLDGVIEGQTCPVEEAAAQYLLLAPRLNLITGDNGLGKSSLLDIAWWALTRRQSKRKLH